jgi:hypothetical protein
MAILSPFHGFLSEVFKNGEWQFGISFQLNPFDIRLHRFKIASNQSAAGGVQLLCSWQLIDLLSFISVGPQKTR